MKFAITVEVKAGPNDTCPDIGTEEVEFDSLEVAQARSHQIEAETNAKYIALGLPVRGRVVSIEQIGP